MKPALTMTTLEQKSLQETAEGIARNLWVNDPILVGGTEYRRAPNPDGAPLLLMRRFPRIRRATFSIHGYRAFLRRTDQFAIYREVREADCTRFIRDLPELISTSVERSKEHLLGTPRVSEEELWKLARPLMRNTAVGL